MVNKNEIGLSAPVPLEYLNPSSDLTGAAGTNRAPSFITQQISAQNDLEAVQTWLAEFDDSPQTKRTYRKESERLLLWALIEKRKALSSLTRDDLRDYQSFLEQPQPATRWCGPRKLRSDPNWRPFEGALSAESIAHAITIINALFNYLVEAGYLSGNPLGLMRRKLRKQFKQSKMVERFLEQSLWQIVIDYIENLPKDTEREKTDYERKRYLLHLLYLLGPRVSEVANHKMNSMQQIRGKWWWQVTGKGQKTQRIPVNNAMLDALMRYRQFYGLSSLPGPDDDNSLFLSLNGQKGVANNMIYRLVKQIFSDCAATIEKNRPDFANKLKQASTHWLRHTSITHQTDAGIELRYIKRNARHESVETTMLYQHAEEEQWHDAMSEYCIMKK
ncbi:MAG TPA: tyrosine-type recombinase/integrase [Gammaproteobacteria bacterium]|nr:tyrosine-type recombinase/integrase [Gammaproteobacteria bacterium]